MHKNDLENSTKTSRIECFAACVQAVAVNSLDQEVIVKLACLGCVHRRTRSITNE